MADLTDAQWERLAPSMPVRSRRPDGTDRPSMPKGNILAELQQDDELNDLRRAQNRLTQAQCELIEKPWKQRTINRPAINDRAQRQRTLKGPGARWVVVGMVGDRGEI